mgnify:CR=1
MEEVLKKRISRKAFLKTLAIVAGSVLLATPLSFLREKKDEEIGYGSRPYGM